MHTLKRANLAFLPAIIFLIMAFIEIDLPGLYMDEAYLDAFTVKILDKSKTVDRPLFNLPDNILDKNYRYPITGGIYVGLIGTYLGVPFYKLFGFNIFTLRMYHALYGAITVYLVFLILERITSRRIAFWGSMLLAIDAGFLVTYRTQGWNVISPMPFFLFAILLALPRGNDEYSISSDFSISKKRAFLIGLLFGLACYGYFVFLLFGPPLLLSLLLWGRSRLTRKTLLAGAMGCFVGYLPLLYALLSIVIQSPDMISSFIERTGSSMSLSDRLGHILGIFRDTFNNSATPQRIAGPHYTPFSEVKVYLWLFFAVVSCVLWRHKKYSIQINFLLFCVLSIACYFLESMKFGNQIAVHHAVIVLPLAYMALATLISILTSGSNLETNHTESRLPGFVGWTIITTCALLLAPINLMQHFAMTRQLLRTGGIELYSNANNMLAQDLEIYHPEDEIVYCDWGYMLNTFFLTRGANRFTFDVWDKDINKNEKIPALFANNPRLTFVLPKRQCFSATTKSVAEFRNRLHQAAQKAGFICSESKTFVQKDETPVIETITFKKDIDVK
jgi:hypothetical protein